MYQHLFTPGNIGSLKLKNRIVMAPMGIVADTDGGFSKRQIDYYAARAKGGAGLIVTGSVFFTSKFGAPPSGVLEKPHHVARVGELADKVHRYGAKLAIQFNLGGGRCGGMISASEVPTVANPDVFTRALTLEEVKFIVQQAGASAKLAKAGGADAIMLHAYAGYLLDQFQSSEWNHRTDEYGGSLENRMRLTCELIQSIKAACGPKFPVLVKFSVDHGTPEGRKLPEGLEMCKILEKAGCDGMLVDTGSFQTQWNRCIPTVYEPEGYTLEMTKQVKEAVSFPVLAQNKLSNPDLAEQAIANGNCDFVTLGHALLADPDWANKAKKGLADQIRPCIGCNNCLLSINQSRNYQCAVNPWLHHEKDDDIQLRKAEAPRKILVVGGGPAGMSAAQHAVLCGHQAELWEKSDKLGGNMIAAGAPSFKGDVRTYTEYMARETERLGVKICLRKEADADSIKEGGFDQVILATGAKASTLNVPGADGENVSLSLEVLHGQKTPKGRVAVIGGGLVGCEVACSISETADEVTIVEFLPALLATGEEARNNGLALRKLIARSDVKSICNAAVTSIDENGLNYTDRVSGEEKRLECDSVVIAVGFRSCNDLRAELDEAGIPCTVIGDADSPRKIMNAVKEGLTAILDFEE